MPTINVYNADRQQVAELELAPEVFGAEVREHLLYAAVRWQRARARAGTHAVKNRSDVRGGGRKPWKQKGTGRARHGSSRSPIWRGGGVVFGPVTRDHGYKLNKKVRKLALRSALSRRAEEGAVVVLDELKLADMKTRLVVDFMKRFELEEMLLVVAEHDDVLFRAARNLQNVKVLVSDGINVYDILDHNRLVMTTAAVAAVTSRLTAATEA